MGDLHQLAEVAWHPLQHHAWHRTETCAQVRQKVLLFVQQESGEKRQTSFYNSLFDYLFWAKKNLLFFRHHIISFL